MLSASARSSDKEKGHMIGIAEMLSVPRTPLWSMVRQCGVTQVVAGLDFRQMHAEKPEELPWGLLTLARTKAAFEAEGLSIAVIESRPPMDLIKRGCPGRDEEIETVIALIRSMGEMGIPVWCYEWMPYFNWLRTSATVPARGGAMVTGFDLDHVRGLTTECGEITEEALWDNLGYFLDCVLPEAESAGVKLAMHPDDPPLSPIAGMGRIMRSVENFQRLLDLHPSPMNGICLCQGNFALMTDDVPSAIRQFARQEKLFFVHFRDVRGTPESFVETFHDNGQTDMLACMQAYREVGFAGVLRPDHVPTMEGDDNDRPGYSSIGRLYALGYIRGLREAAYA